MSECKHGLRNGCVYCHGHQPAAAESPAPKRRSKATRLAVQMNERITMLKQRLRELRGQ